METNQENREAKRREAKGREGMVNGKGERKTKPGYQKLQWKQIKKTQDELQWIVAQRLLSALTIPGFS